MSELYRFNASLVCEKTRIRNLHIVVTMRYFKFRSFTTKMIVLMLASSSFVINPKAVNNAYTIAIGRSTY
jgi:hypothetical protein